MRHQARGEHSPGRSPDAPARQADPDYQRQQLDQGPAVALSRSSPANSLKALFMQRWGYVRCRSDRASSSPSGRAGECRPRAGSPRVGPIQCRHCVDAVVSACPRAAGCREEATWLALFHGDKAHSRPLVALRLRVLAGPSMGSWGYEKGPLQRTLPSYFSIQGA